MILSQEALDLQRALLKTPNDYNLWLVLADAYAECDALGLETMARKNAEYLMHHYDQFSIVGAPNTLTESDGVWKEGEWFPGTEPVSEVVLEVSDAEAKK